MPAAKGPPRGRGTGAVDKTAQKARDRRCGGAGAGSKAGGKRQEERPGWAKARAGASNPSVPA